MTWNSGGGTSNLSSLTSTLALGVPGARLARMRRKRVAGSLG